MIRSLFSVLNHPLNRDFKIRTLIRLVWWKINQLIFKIPAIIEIVPGRKIICYPDSSSGGLIIYKKLFDYEEMTYLQTHLTPSSTFIDIGVNIGDYTLIASSIITKKNIYAFEPYPPALARFQENLNLNNVTNVRVVDKVISDKNGTEYFALEYESEVNHISPIKTNKTFKVKSITLDTFVENEKLTYIDFLKVDVEGAEMKVLKGAQNLLQRHKIGTLLLELNKNNQAFGTTSSKILSFLRNFGYKIYRIEDRKLVRLRVVNNDAIINVVCKR